MDRLNLWEVIQSILQWVSAFVDALTQGFDIQVLGATIHLNFFVLLGIFGVGVVLTILLVKIFSN